MAGSVLENIQSVLQKTWVREFLAEFLSTYVLMVSGWVGGGPTEAVLSSSPQLTPGVISFPSLPLAGSRGKKRKSERPFSSCLFGTEKGSRRPG